MNEIIKLTAQTIGGEPQQTVNARELHARLEVKTEFKDWIARRIKDFDFQEGIDFCSFLSESSGGRPGKEYAITINMAKELCMVERNDLGRKWRRYFIDCEQQLQTVKQAVAIPQTLPEALRLAADLAEKNQQLLEQAKIDTPKAEWCDRVTAANEHMTITQAAKTLNYPPRKFKDYLRQIGFIYANSDTPMQEHIKAGRAVLRYAHYTTSDGNPVEKPYTHITSKGLKWLYERMVRDGLIEQQQDLFDKTA